MIRQDWSSMKKLLFFQMAAGKAAVEATATGNPLTFLTDLARPLKSLLIPFTPVQSGSGDPSPQNIRPIVAWDGVKVWNGGKNVFDGELEKGVLDSNGQNASSSINVRSKNFIPVVPGTQYYMYFVRSEPGAWNMRLYFYGADKTHISNSWRQSGNLNIPSNVYFIRFYMDSAYSAGTDRDIAINYPSTETSYEAPAITETDISFTSPVYGGTLDVVSGVLKVEWGVEVFVGSNDEQWGVSVSAGKNRAVLYRAKFVQRPKLGASMFANYLKSSNNVADWNGWIASSTGNFLCYIPDEYSTSELWNAYLAEHPLTIVYELETPQEITLTPEQITALKGENTIWSDADGSMTATYLKKG